MANRRGSAVEGCGSSRREFWSQHIAACEGSGVTIAQYCRDHELSYAGYQWWKSELKRRSLPTVFSEVRLPAAVNIVDGTIEVVLGGRRVVRVHSGFDETTLSRVVAVLEQTPC